MTDPVLVLREALDLDALKVVVASAKADYESYRDNGWAGDYADDVSLLIAEVEALRKVVADVRALHVEWNEKADTLDRRAETFFYTSGRWGFESRLKDRARELRGVAARLLAVLDKEEE